MRDFSGFGKIEDINKPHVLVYRELGYKTLYIKGFNTLEALRNFVLNTGDKYTPIKRLEEGK